MEGLLRFPENRPVRRAGGLDGLDGEQDAELGVRLEVLHSRRGELPRRGDPGLLLCPATLIRGHNGERRGDEGRGREDRDQATQTPCRSSLDPGLMLSPPLLLLLLPIALIDAGLQVRALGTPDRQIRGRRPGLELLESGTAQKEARIAVGASPLSGRPGQAPFLTEVLSSTVDPRAQAAPGAEQRLVGDLDRGLPGGGFPIEGEQPMTPEGVDGPVDRRVVHVESIELAPGDASAGVLPPLSEGDQPQERLLGGTAALGLGGLVDAVGPGGQGPRDPADPPVRGEG
jgi:hypothetical protein